MQQRQHETEWFPEQTFPLNIHTDQVHWISGLEKNGDEESGTRQG